MPKQIYSVAVYMVDLCYGGPEEGGWYYQAGHPDEDYAQFTRLFKHEDAAITYRQRLDRVLCRRLNKGRRDISSVLSEGEYRAQIEDGLPRAYPSERPHYE